MKVLVTGATGFLGGGLVRRLLAEGCEVRIFNRTGHTSDELSGLKPEIAIGDVTDLPSLQRACQGIDTVFHLAGLVAYSPLEREAMEHVNVGGTANVIAACIAKDVRKLVYVSSVVAIGASFDGKKPLNEESPFNIHHLNLGYFETKHQAELLVVQAASSGKLDAVMINPSTIYGPADAKKGSRKAQLKVAQGKFPYYPPGGVSVVSLEDVIDSLIAVWKTGRKGERYIISGENLLIKNVFDIIANCAGVKAPWIALPKPVIFGIGHIGDCLELIGKKGPLNSETAWTSVLYHWFDSSKAQAEFSLKFKPAEYAIEQSIRWIKDNKLA